MKIAGMILSAAGYKERRAACRETWIKDAKAAGMDCFFVIGSNSDAPASISDDILTVPCGDDYHSLSLKTNRFLSHEISRSCDFLWCCDDDTLVKMDRLIECIADCEKNEIDYRGMDIGPPIYPFSYAAGGSGFILSRKAVTVMVENPMPKHCWPDRELGRILDKKVKFLADARLYWRADQTPSAENDLISCHYMSPEAMRSVYSSWQTAF